MAIHPGERVCFSLFHLSGEVQGLKELNKSLINDELGMTEKDGQFNLHYDRLVMTLVSAGFAKKAKAVVCLLCVGLLLAAPAVHGAQVASRFD